MAPAAGGLQSTAIDVRQARFIRFSQWPVIRTIVDATFGDVIKRISATSGAQNAFASEPVDPAFEQRLLSVGMTPDNLDAFVSDELQFNNTSRWVDENVPQIRVPSVIIGALGDQIVEIDHVRRLAKTLPDTELITVDGNHVISQPSVRRCAPALTTPPWKAIRRVARRKAAAIRPVRRGRSKSAPRGRGHPNPSGRR